MSNNKKPNGYFETLLAVDVETTGLCFGDNPVTDGDEYHQIVSIGLIVANNKFEPIEQHYFEIKWNDRSVEQRNKNPEFGKQAEAIHGLTRQHLNKHGITEDEAVVNIGQLILKYWGPENCIRLVGHNVHLFDRVFVKDLFDRHQIKIKWGNRHYDTNSIAYATAGAFNSDDAFSAFGFDHREDHNALDDAKMSLEVCRLTRILWQQKVGLLAND